jgi:hypothetical protein
MVRGGHALRATGPIGAGRPHTRRVRREAFAHCGHAAMVSRYPTRRKQVAPTRRAHRHPRRLCTWSGATVLANRRAQQIANQVARRRELAGRPYEPLPVVPYATRRETSGLQLRSDGTVADAVPATEWAGLHPRHDEGIVFIPSGAHKSPSRASRRRVRPCASASHAGLPPRFRAFQISSHGHDWAQASGMCGYRVGEPSGG